MKRKTINKTARINGFYMHDLIRGFLGEKDMGNSMLRRMGLTPKVIPFSVAKFLQNRKAFWKDRHGNEASIRFTLKDNQLECFGSYLDKRKSIRMFREWSSGEDSEKIARLESEAIGDLCMRCIYEPLFGLKTTI
ncbi:MAG: hypothetical protein NC311_11525 [Muribaculaceae bacterium]|nr:hypothetical protein [Muribaculaceae bacterium]